MKHLLNALDLLNNPVALILIVIGIVIITAGVIAFVLFRKKMKVGINAIKEKRNERKKKEQENKSYTVSAFASREKSQETIKQEASKNEENQ